MTTSHQNLSLPEPSLPEHQLIRDSAPLPKLSSGFRARVMSECTVSILHAKRVRRWKIGGTVAAVCILSLLLMLAVPNPAVDEPNIVTPEPPQISVPQLSPSSYSGAGETPPSGSRNAVQKDDSRQILDDLQQRQQMFDANMLPLLR
jgi:hypothetical protein